ncbi:complement decay-accelerating factor isoform X2 [Nerophis lumbriciformis]|uniref:complement decay-accelerating factor isoform X2 n=1 Tax=Nerophis lumbriciformis TaxID=546530 RepID=UPI002ADFCEAF|nr:complement decay-accelerating factor-like isoform X2 [Nerophis lumbriciformis]
MEELLLPLLLPGLLPVLLPVLAITSTQRKITCVLVFFVVFVWRSEANCPRPFQGNHKVLSLESVLVNSFQEGSSAIMECGTGYVLESGSGSITCHDGNWTQLTLTCKKKDCGPPTPQPNMTFNISAGTLLGDVIKVTCDEGYRIRGSSYKECIAAGWKGTASCLTITCPKPAEMTNGKVLWDSQDLPKYGETLQFECDGGYTLTGERSLVCGKGGKYQAPPPQCKEASTSTSPSATTPALRDKTITTAAATNTSQEKSDIAANATKDTDYLPVVVSVICISLGGCIVAICLHRFLLKKKGSYDTREDLKPELLSFQNV